MRTTVAAFLLAAVGIVAAAHVHGPHCHHHGHEATTTNAPQSRLDASVLAAFDPTPGMKQAISLAQQAVKNGGAPYGAVIADPVTGNIVATGANNASYNPIWHGEMMAITDLSVRNPDKSVYDLAPNLVLLTTAEPCPMCMSAIEWSGFAAVYYGASIPFLIDQKINQINMRATQIAAATPFNHTVVIGGILKTECDALYT